MTDRAGLEVDSKTQPDHVPTPARAWVILAVGLFSISFSPILVRFAGEAPGLAVAVWRTAFAALIVGTWAGARLMLGERRRIPVRAAGSIVLAAVFLAFHFILWIESLYHTSVASASVLVSTTPIFLAILAYVVLRERVKPAILIAVVVGVAGAALLAAGDVGSAVGDSTAWGNGLALAASFAAAVYLLIGSLVRKGLDWLSYVAPLYVLVAVIVFSVALIGGAPLTGYSSTFYLLCLGMAVGPQVLGHGSFNYVLRFISPTVLSLLILLEPVVSSILAFILFAEQPGPTALGGMLLILISIALAVLGSARAR